MRILARYFAAVLLVASVASRIATCQQAVSAAAPDSGGSKRNLLPALEIAGFLGLLSAYDRVAYANVMQDGKKVYSSTFASTWDHLKTQQWVYDQDPFNTNQFQHPYQGAIMYQLARSSGHNFWTSLVHADIGSFIWKMAGETDPPSINDMITTGQAGSLLGEALYRIADLVLRDGDPAKPHRAHEYAAAIISPPGGLNRRIFGDRFKALLPDSAPATTWQFRFGASLASLAHDSSASSGLLRGNATLGFSIAYGLPGRAGYEYTRPMDYFDFEFEGLSSASNPIENVMIRGLLAGHKTRDTENEHGIWGLYGSYDYISPFAFRISSTALSLGTTRQYTPVPGFAIQGTLLGGVGYGAAGSTTVIASTPTNAAIRDYHFGATPQALLALRFIGTDRLAIDLNAREYYVSGVGSDDTRGSETIFRGTIGATLRVYGNHAIGARFVASTRDARYGSVPDRKTSEGNLTVSYSLLGSGGVSAVKWSDGVRP